MDFAEFACDEVLELSKDFLKVLKIYYMEKLNGFSEDQKIQIVNAAVTNLFTQVHVTNIQIGIGSIDKFIKTTNLMIEYVKKECEKNEN